MKNKNKNKMKLNNVLKIIGICTVLLFLPKLVYGENIDPSDDDSQYAYGENVGWLNFEPNEGPGVKVSDVNLTGYVWAENIGWIILDPNDADPNTGVSNDGTGLLTGLAWGENVGWINFNPKVPGDPNHYGVTIGHDGNFAGWAWGENIGWIHFSSTAPVAYKVQTSWITSCVVDFDDLGRFCDLWLKVGVQLKADFNNSNDVDFKDYCTIAELWLQLCPAGWPLK
jgi:hypothetical protein